MTTKTKKFRIPYLNDTSYAFGFCSVLCLLSNPKRLKFLLFFGDVNKQVLIVNISIFRVWTKRLQASKRFLFILNNQVILTPPLRLGKDGVKSLRWELLVIVRVWIGSCFPYSLKKI